MSQLSAAPSVTYWVLRDSIKNGDIVHIHRPKSGFNFKTLVYSVIQFFTGSPIYHNVVAIWMTAPGEQQKLMAIESNIHGGKRMIEMSMYSANLLELQPLPSQFEFAKMEETLLSHLGQQPYGLRDFISIGLLEFFGVKAKNHKGQVCSELCADAWIQAGVPLRSTLISPGKLKSELIKLGVPVTLNTNV